MDSHDVTLRMQRKIRPYDHPPSFSAFFSNWIQLLQSHVFPRYVVRFNDQRVNEGATIRAFAVAMESIWPSLNKLALTELVRHRYIRTHVLGSGRDADTEFVPDKVRWATDYLRVGLAVSPEIIVGRDDPNSFETGLPPDLSSNSFARTRTPFSAAVTLLYQIRCNLFHGVKGFRNRSARDELLTTLGVQIICDIAECLGENVEQMVGPERRERISHQT